MMQEHEDPKFDAWLQNMAQSYHAPRTTPRDAIWKRIEDARRNKRVIELRPWLRWAVAAAAVLILGIGIGRWSANQGSAPASSSSAAAGTQVANEIDSLANVAYQVAATQYLSRTEAFLRRSARTPIVRQTPLGSRTRRANCWRPHN